MCRTYRFLLFGLIVLVALTCGTAPAKEKTSSKTKKTAKKDASTLTLEKLFPEKGLFGTKADATGFSVDGRYAAYLYRPYMERRHGNDLWVYDFNTGKTRRITSVSVMAAFQQSTRDVQADRVKKAKAAVAKDKSKGKKLAKKNSKNNKKAKIEDLLTDAQRGGDWVDEKDADAKTAPRYSGVASFVWSPTSSELLFTSRGDIYRYRVGAKAPERLTKTTTRKTGVRYLPDGKGYTYLRDGALMRVRFDSSLVEQLDPSLPRDEKMTSYRMSPDGKKLVIVTRKGADSKAAIKKVAIVSYRDRFAKVREVPRLTADDKMPDQSVSIYLYDLTDLLHEKHKLVRIFSRKMTGPRDLVGTPNWSLDSRRVTFAAFDQKASRIQVYETAFAPPRKESTRKKPSDASAKPARTETKKAASKSDAAKSKEASKIVERPAKIVHQELHTGGPNTPRMIQPMFLADNRRIVLLSELSGFRHLHVLDPVYETLDQLTRGRYEVYPERISKDHRRLFVTTTKDNPARHHVYCVALDSGKMTRLSPADGTYSKVAVSNDGKHVLANFVRYGKLQELQAIDVAKKNMVQLTHGQPAKAKFVTTARPQFFTYKNRHGQDIHGMLFKPDRWSAKDRRPLLIYVYGGPLGTRKMVVDGSYSSDGFLFAWYMAKRHGYVTCTIDPRGVSGYGGLFEKANYEHVGRPQVEDLVDGVKHLVKNYGVDPKRVGIHGWSFGGFQTQMCMYTKPDVFAVGIAGAGPTEWENYNSWYTTGTVGSSRVGVTDLKKYSLLPLAKNLKGKLLLLHGMEDSNVLYQDTVRIYRELLKAHKETQVELFLDPTGSHGLGGDVKNLGRFRKYEQFLTRYLGTGKPAGK